MQPPVQLGIRQARYCGRTKTLFQLCLAAAVANLTLLAAASGAFAGEHLQARSLPLIVLGTMFSLIFSLVSVLAMNGDSALVHHLTRPVPDFIRPSRAGSRPAF